MVQDTDHLSRRTILASVASLIGVAALPEKALACAPASPIGSFLTDHRFLAAFCDTLLPAGEVGGAAAANVPARFLELMISWASAKRRMLYANVLEQLASELAPDPSRPFTNLRETQKSYQLQKFDENAYSDNPPELAPGYRNLKRLLADIYYFSEIGATQELRYEQTPGRWDGCVPMTDDTKTWVV